MKWLERSGSFVVSLLVHAALLLWLLSANLAGEPPQPQNYSPIAVELVRLPPRAPPKEEPGKEPEKAKLQKQKPQPERALKLPPVEAGPPAHEISTNDDEWVAPRVNNNKGWSNVTRRVPPDYAEKVKGQVISKMDYPEDAVYPVERGQKGPPVRQQCRVAYEITVDRNGNMLSYKYDRCGHDKLDAAAEAALQKAGPFPPPPDTGAEKYVIYGVQIFRLK
ncbi:MAG: TonB family protein [Georgfuchsia sp.]